MKIIPECKKCNKPIPLIWFLFSSENKNFTCSSCGAVHQWTKSTGTILGLIVLFWVVLNGISRYYFLGSMPRLVISSFLLILIIYLFKLTRIALTAQTQTNEKT